MYINISTDLDLKMLSVDCIYLHRYRYKHTKYRFEEYVEKFDIED